jgi:DNA primase
MTFDRDLLPDWPEYADREGLTLHGRGKWRSTLCPFHDDSSPSLRVNTAGGGWCCMSCGASGGDVLAFHMRLHGLEFIEAAKALRAWHDDGKHSAQRPRTLSTRDGLELLYQDAMVFFVVGCDWKNGKTPSKAELDSVAAAARRVLVVYEGVNSHA